MTSQRPRGLLRVLLIAVLAIGIPGLLLEYGRFTPFWAVPCAPIFGLWGVLLLIAGVRRKRREGKGAIAFNLGILFLALAAVEIYLGAVAKQNTRLVRREKPGTFAKLDPVLGFRSRPNFTSRFTSMTGDETIFDAVYTMGEDGLRVRPPLSDPPPEKSALLFSCSYVFGTGLNDDEAWPWLLEKELDGRYRCYNFGFPGYSPNQMLAYLESGEAAAIAEYPPRHVVFLAIVDHARRVIGQSGYARNEPRFELQPDGTVKRNGLWGDAGGHRWEARARQLLHHSHLARLLMKKLAPSRSDVGLFVAIVKASRDWVSEHWPDCQFHVLLWDFPPSLSDPIEKRMEAEGVDLTRASTFLTGLRDDAAPWRLHRLDDHPNARAAAAIAKYLASVISSAETE